MEELKFFDLVEKKAFETDNYVMKIHKGRRIAHATSPWGNKVARIVGKNF